MHMMLKSTIKVPAQGIFGYGPDIVDAIANQMRGMRYLAQSKMHWLLRIEHWDQKGFHIFSIVFRINLPQICLKSLF